VAQVTRLLASLTSLSPLALGDDARRLIDAGVDALHVDIGDGHFVPFITYGPALVAALADQFDAAIEVHLMVDDPEAWIREIVGSRSRVARIWFHIESTRHPWRVASLVRRFDIQAGVALDPVTPIAVLERLGSSVGAVNLLATDHDFVGDQLLGGTADRVRAARAVVGSATAIQVDGGVSANSAAELVRAGADELVVGRAICAQQDWSAAVAELRHMVAVQ
jgi:ribulose-phosphate 3-epimerase